MVRKKEKEFDCVKMKHDIQDKILQDMKNYTPEEWRRLRQERILSDPLLGPMWRRLPRVRTSGLVKDDEKE